MNIEIRDFDLSLANDLADLEERAYIAITKGARPGQSVKFITHILGNSNPAGVSNMAIAFDNGKLVGSLAIIPFRFRRNDGSLVTGKQMGYYFVDYHYQGKGLGADLIKALTNAYSREQDSFLYVYPQKRSMRRFKPPVYQDVSQIPTTIYLPTLNMLRPYRNITKYAFFSKKKHWEIEEINSEMAQKIAIENFNDYTNQLGFVRDEKYFCWRFCGPDTNYRFLKGKSLEEKSSFLVVFTQHKMAGLNFTILVDILSHNISLNYSIAVKAVRKFGNALFVYSNNNLKELEIDKSSMLPFGISVPNSLNPRPVVLRWFPNESAVSQNELVQNLTMTADWLGF